MLGLGNRIYRVGNCWIWIYKYGCKTQSPTNCVHQTHYKWVCSEHYRLLASLWKGQVLLVEFLRAPGPVESRGRPPSCHHCRTTPTIWLEETRWASKNHLAENDWKDLTVTEFRSPHGMAEGKGKRYLAPGRQYGNALLGVRHQEEEEMTTDWCCRRL